MTKFFLVFILIFFIPVYLFSKEEIPPTIERALDFTEWLEKNAKKFTQCTPMFNPKKDEYVLCDKTTVSAGELKRLFALTPEALVKELESKKIKVEILCDSTINTQDTFAQSCKSQIDRKDFAGISQLHGKYIPEEKLILLRSSASKGSLIHEYLHFLQSENDQEIYGKKYKKERNKIQSALIKYMNSTLALIKSKENLDYYKVAGELMINFGVWQDLIDERSLFLLYLNYGNTFGVEQRDLDLAKKNMGFICQNKKLKNILPKEQCNI